MTVSTQQVCVFWTIHFILSMLNSLKLVFITNTCDSSIG